MKLITRDTDYAVRALCYIAKNRGDLVSAADLVKDLAIPRPFLRQLLQTLNKRKILKSYKGKGGGFELGRAADKIFLTDLIEIFQGPLQLNECIFKKRICPNRNTCALRLKITNIERQVISGLRSITIRNLLDNGSNYGKKKNHKD